MGLQNGRIAEKLRISPGRVSQRKQVIQRMVDQEDSLSPF
jgi:DNA-binding NarL/FixJ family response regulator